MRNKPWLIILMTSEAASIVLVIACAVTTDPATCALLEQLRNIAIGLSVVILLSGGFLVQPHPRPGQRVQRRITISKGG